MDPLELADGWWEALAVSAALELIFLSISILINQNRMQGLADLHLHISLLAERESTRPIRLVAKLGQHAGLEWGKG